MDLRERFIRVLSRIKPFRILLEARPWVGYLLLFGLLLGLLSMLAIVGALLFMAFTVGGRQGEGGEGAEFSKGLPMALWWLFGILSVVPVSLLYCWWDFGRGSRPSGTPSDLKAAEAGDGPAAYRLGLHYRHKDTCSARAWFLKASLAGVPEAMVELAQDLREGRGGPKDLAEAQNWLLRASALGAPEAGRLLAEVKARLGDFHSERGI